jgi:hypothetical protein
VHYACTDCSAVTVEATSQSGPVVVERLADDDYGAVFTVAPPDLSAAVTLSVLVGGVADIAGQTFTPIDTPSAWFQPGEQAVHRSRSAAEGFATIHYHRPAGDYDGWGLHVWDGAAAPTVWTSPLPPVGRDVFGLIFEVPLVEGADRLAYIIHKGDEKDPNADMHLVFADDGHEVWQVQGANPARPYVAPLRQ